MLRRKFDSPIEEALAATLLNRLTSAVYAALNHAIAYHEEAGQAKELKRHWKQIGAWFVAHDLIRSAQTRWPPAHWEFPRIFCVQPDTAQFLMHCVPDDIVAPVQFWFDGVPLDPRIDPDPTVEHTKVQRLRDLRAGLNQ
jgi:hypothetical protein